jgi:hypothetical protein
MAKDLVEATARVVVGVKGEVMPSNSGIGA